jgi:hypothetical protein
MQGYNDVAQVYFNVRQHMVDNIPLDAQWVDNDYMWNFMDFTVDPTSWSGFGN